MQIDNLIISEPLMTVLNELKTQLNANGISLLNKMIDSGDDIMVCCPYHKNGQERRPSAGIRKADGMFHCLACGETHSLPEVIAHCFKHTDFTFGYKWLSKNFASAEVENREGISLNLERNNVSHKSSILADSRNNKHICIGEDELDKYRYTHPYLYKRGLTDDVIEKFDLGYDKQTDSITFPVRDKNGDCMFVARRAVKTKQFNIPKGINKPLYGLYEVLQSVCIPRGVGRYPILLPDDIYVCEGLFDCLRLWCNGKYAVAGFGCLFSSYQIKQLQDLPGRTLILAFDNDDAGREATKRVRKLITNKIVKEVVLPPFRKDIGECTDDEIQKLVKTLC